MLLTLFLFLQDFAREASSHFARTGFRVGKASFFQLLIVMPAVIGWAFLI